MGWEAWAKRASQSNMRGAMRATTWQTTIEELSQSERKLLNILAWLAPEAIPLSLLEGNIVDGADARDALAGLASWSLARWMADREAVTVHRRGAGDHASVPLR